MRYFLASLLLLLLACRPAVIEKMAHATKQIDATYSAQYELVAHECRNVSHNWTEYDACMKGWNEGADAVGILHDTTLALDLVEGRRQFKSAGCAWYRAVAMVDALSPVSIPAAQTVLASRWRRKC